MTRSKVTSRLHHDVAHLHPLTNVPTKDQHPTPYVFLDIAQARFYRSIQVKVTMARSKVKSRSHHDTAHLHPLTNVPTKYQLPTPYGFWGVNLTVFLDSLYMVFHDLPIHLKTVKAIIKNIKAQSTKSVIL